MRHFLLAALAVLMVVGNAVTQNVPVPHIITATVATSGTPVQFIKTSPTYATWATVQAPQTNTGTVCFGNSSVKASTNNGTCLSAGTSGPLGPLSGQIYSPYDLSQWWVDSTVNGQGVVITYVR